MPDSILTPLQARVLHALFEAGIGQRGFYLTGGTALSEFYLQHRLSEDLDLFTRRSDLSSGQLGEARGLLERADLRIAAQQVQPEFARFFVYLESARDEQLKVEFARDPGRRMAAPLTTRGLVVDSLLDICVNKICAIFGREPSDPKDFVDLYFILRETDHGLDYLLSLAREKEAAFEHEDGPLVFAANLLDVSQARPLPRMLKPLTSEELTAALLPVAQQLILRLRPEGPHTAKPPP